MRILLLTTLLLTCHVSTFSHMDKTISISANGNLAGLPKKFQPAILDLHAKVFTIGKVTLKLPECLHQYFPSGKTHNLYIAASWNHHPFMAGVKPYILLTFVSKNKGHAYRHEFELDTLMPISLTVLKYRKQKNGSIDLQSDKLVLSDACIDAARKSYTRQQKLPGRM